jgi:hypothetical protein
VSLSVKVLATCAVTAPAPAGAAVAIAHEAAIQRTMRPFLIRPFFISRRRLRFRKTAAALRE